jgi:hypothetical protein
MAKAHASIGSADNLAALLIKDEEVLKYGTLKESLVKQGADETGCTHRLGVPPIYRLINGFIRERVVDFEHRQRQRTAHGNKWIERLLEDQLVPGTLHDASSLRGDRTDSTRKHNSPNLKTSREVGKFHRYEAEAVHTPVAGIVRSALGQDVGQLGRRRAPSQAIDWNGRHDC